MYRKFWKFKIFYYKKDTCGVNLNFPEKYTGNFTIYERDVKYFSENYKTFGMSSELQKKP